MFLLSRRGRRRNATQIIGDILSVASDGMRKTGIVYGANLNAKRAEKYIRLLVGKGFMSIKEGPTGSIYTTTEKGREWLSDYKKYIELEERLERLKKFLTLR